MPKKTGLKAETIKKIREIFTRFPEVEEVILYGSRAMGNFRPGSDIDLSILGKNLDLQLMNSISLQLDDLMLPTIFDVSIFQHIQNPDLLDHIRRVGKVIYQKAIE